MTASATPAATGLGSPDGEPAGQGPGRDYRPDVDGLRAVAVVSVVLFHLGVPVVSGGYTGVDVFFVISGYLISGHILRDLAAGRFTIIGFYERRVRRIFPALLATLAATAIAGFVIFMPDELRDLGAQTLAAAASCANILFWLQTDYFAGPAELKPLLHTWSLAVEEQFYLLIPAVLLLVDRLARARTKSVLVALALVSFLASCLWAFLDPTGNYFLPHTRAWELLLGSIIAAGVVPAITNSRINQWVSATGLVLIILPMFLLTRDSVFPAWNAVPTCVGAAMLIHSGGSGSTIVSRLLSLRPFVAIGLISYSLYLVHWPLIVFTKYQLLRDLRIEEKLMLVAAMLLLAWLSWRFVEQPFRRRRMPRVRLFAWSGAASATLAVAGIAAFALDGFPKRFGAEAKIAERDRAQERSNARCFLKEDWRTWSGNECFLTQGGETVILLWGDSHANHYAPALRDQAGRYRSSILLYASAGCPPILDVTIAKRPHCRENNDRIPEIVKTFGVKRVVLSAYWERILEDNDLDASALAPTLRRLAAMGVDVKVIGDNPDFPFANPSFLGVRLARRPTPLEPYYTSVRNDFGTNGRLAKLVGRDNLFDPMIRLCRNEECLAYENGQLLMTDNAHFSSYGAARMLGDLDPIFQPGVTR